MTIFCYVHDWREYFENSNFMKMNNYLSDVMVDKFKILILYAFKAIKVVDIRKIILEKAFGRYYMTRINCIPYLPNYLQILTMINYIYLEFLEKDMRNIHLKKNKWK